MEVTPGVNKIQFRPDRKAELVSYLVRLILIFAAWMLVARFLFNITSLEYLVAFFKFGSLLVLVTVSGDLGWKVSIQSGRLLFYGNRIIVAGSALVLVLLALKAGLLLFNAYPAKSPGWFMIFEVAPSYFWRGLLGWLLHNSWWMSSAPIAAYGVLNLSALLFSMPVRNNTDLRNLVLLYTVFNTGPMVFGLIGAAGIIGLSSMEDGFKSVFFSGAVGVLLLLSALLSKAIEIMLFDKDANIA